MFFYASITFTLLVIVSSKYMEGQLKTSDNWAFLARFCFLSEEGEYEYHIEYDEEQGDINLLLYYDTEDQWPAVYKTNKSCREKEAVLHVEQNQIINLTAKYPYRELSGCYYTSYYQTTLSQRYTHNIPTVPYKKQTTKHLPDDVPTTATATYVTESASYEDNFSTTTFDYNNNFTETALDDSSLDYVTLETTETSTIQTTYVTTTTTTKSPIKKRNVMSKLPLQSAKSNTKIVCHNSRRFRSSRERWWFFAVSNCNGTKGIQIRYKILMTNGAPEDYWHHHFSADQFYILPVLMTFTLAYAFLLLAIVVCSIELKSRQLLHSTYKLFVVSVTLQFSGILLQDIAYLKYAVNGIGFPNAKMFGSMFMGASESCFLLLLLLLAKGYTVTRGRLPVAASIKLTIFMCLYITTYLCLFIYETKVFDPGEVLYLYESPAGYGLIVLRVCAWCMFIYSTIFTLKHYPEKANFYYPFNICGTLWCIAGPAFILSANTYIDKWVRESVVCGVLMFVAFGGHLMFLILTMPSVANKNFPYHVRTSQIGIMEITGVAGANTIDQFSHHLYQPSNTVAETVIIPLTRRTEEIFENLYTQQMIRNSFRNNASHQSISQTAEPAVDIRNTTMENVLHWSMAKNLPMLENGTSHFERLNSTNTSVRSNVSSSGNNGEQSRYHLDDYIREVPVELFTVSKMVINTPNVKNKENGEQ